MRFNARSNRVAANELTLRAKPNESLTLDEMRASLPTIFAEHAHESRSDRYVYISTAEMLNELIKRDFVPVEARVSRTRIEDKQGFTKHLVRMRPRGDLVNPSMARRVGDTSFEVVLRNAHDGTGSYQFFAIARNNSTPLWRARLPCSTRGRECSRKSRRGRRSR
jgi:Domain of unknown function (DUF932)